MSDNQRKMSLEERIVQTLKDEHLFRLVGDEDAITELVTRAIKEALFQPQRVLNSGYGSSYRETDSVVVEAARAAAKTYAETIAKTILDAMLAEPENVQTIQKAITELLPLAIVGKAQEWVSMNQNVLMMRTQQYLLDMKLIRFPGT
jgi:hypothetical protein